MAQKVIIDPVTRIEGHLKVEVEIENGAVKDAWTSGTMYRGFEQLLVGKDPRDAVRITSRVCGVCNTIHGMTSMYALDEAFGAVTPDAGRIIRNLIFALDWLADHPLHFYHLSALDYIDIMAVASYSGNDPALVGVKDKIVSLVQANDTYPLTPRYEPDGFVVNDPVLVTTAVSHYLQALEIRKELHDIAALWAGRMPFFQNTVVGGVGIRPTLDKIVQTQQVLARVVPWLKNVYIKDVVAFGTGPLLPIHQLKVGFGVKNFLGYGAFDLKKSGDLKNRFFKSGTIEDLDLKNVKDLDKEKITEDVKSSYYKSPTGLKPAVGKTDPDPKKAGAYSFLKSPRYDGKPHEGGPLSRMLIMQDPGFVELAGKIGLWPSAVARHAARAYETGMLADAVLTWLDELAKNLDGDVCDDKPVPQEGMGAGLTDAPRSANGHWITIKGGKIDTYQIVNASTWNFSPRDDKGVRGPVEEALIGAPVPDPNNPINVVRVIRSFDPCLACSVHIIEPKTNEILKFKVT